MAAINEFVFQQTRAKCQVCGSSATARIDKPSEKPGIYMSHPTYGISLISCLVCKMHSVEFVHPKVISKYFARSQKNYTPETLISLHNFQSDLCQRQTEYFVKSLKTTKGNLLVFGAGRSLYIQPYKRLCEQVFLIELIPAFRDWACTQSDILVLDGENTEDAGFFHTFDTIILTNVLQRIAFPKAFLSRCSRLLKAGGEIAIEVPVTSLESIAQGNFGYEEINFFAEDSFRALITHQGSFEIKNIVFDPTPRSDPSSVFPDKQSKHLRGTMKAVLINQRPIKEEIILDYEREQLEHYLKSLSFGVFVVSNRIGSWADDEDTEVPSQELKLENYLGH